MRIAIDPDRVKATFAKFKDNSSLRESAQLFARGLPAVEMLQALSMNENALAAFTGFGSVYPGGSLERGILEKVILRVSQLHECQFCVNSHLAMMNALGISADLSPAGEHTSRERVAVEYAEQMTRDANRIGDELFARVRQQFSDPEIVELTFMVGIITLLNRFNNALQVRYHSEFADVRVA